MRLKNIKAIPRPEGNSIKLTWDNSDPLQGICVRRRESTYPTSWEDGDLVVEGLGLNQIIDKNLKGETVYYYTLFPYTGSPAVYENLDTHNRINAMATASYNMAGIMYDLLPGIYYRYDTALSKSDKLSETDKTKGQLRRFLELPASQLDQVYSYAKAMLELYNIDNVNGSLLPLLAEWIGWETDHRIEIDSQRNEIRYAPSLYKTIGILPTVEATVKRIIGWESRTKEFSHNIFLSNTPERLNLWQTQENTDGEWSEPLQPLSLDFAYNGKHTLVNDPGDGTSWLFYHTRRNGKWNIWYKTLGSTDQDWAGSKPLIEGDTLDRHPTASFQAGTLWLFWDSYNPKDDTWKIKYITRTSGTWSSIEEFSTIECKSPLTTVDNSGGLWLFWHEKVGSNWQVKYNRHNGTDWDLASAATLPADTGPVHDGQILFNPSEPTQPLWFFWTRKVPTLDPNKQRWQIVYRTKASIDPNITGDWSAISHIPESLGILYNDCEPSVHVKSDGSFELYMSSNRDGSWAIWRIVLTDATTHTWATEEQITDTPYTERTPIPLQMADDTVLLLYRSNRSVPYTSEIYSATKTLDCRYAGATTVDFWNKAKMALHAQFKDFQTYTYDTGKDGIPDNEDWYSRSTVGIYLTPDTEDQTLILRNQDLLKSALKRFLPIQVRPVFIIETPVYKEKVYTYDFPKDTEQKKIGEHYLDTMESETSETYSGLSEAYQDTAPDWIWLRSWSETNPDHRTVDFNAVSIDTRYRTWHIGVIPGG